MASQQKLSVNLGLDQLPSTDDQALFIQLTRIYNAIRNLASGVDTYTGPLQYDSALWSVLTPAQTLWTAGANRLYLKFSDTVVAGAACNIYDNAGVMTARKAGGPAWAGGDAKGYSTGAVNAGDYGELILLGLCTLYSGLTRGATYWASNATAGNITATKPNANGNRIQPVGYALTDTTFFWIPSPLVPTLDTASLAIPVLTP
jgi:hypothetical protein